MYMWEGGGISIVHMNHVEAAPCLAASVTCLVSFDLAFVARAANFL
jgi:hypothetical protein